MIFESTVRVMGGFPSFPQSVIRDEASQARVSIPNAMRGGQAHRTFIKALPEAWRNDPSIEIFSRVVWLKEGWYPLTPHYHFDWEFGVNGRKVETIMVLLGDISLTEFVLGPIEHPETEARGLQMDPWAAEVDLGIRSGKLITRTIEPGTLILFDNRTLHRARPAMKAGWRLLMRAIRGLPGEESRCRRAGYRNPGQFTTCRNGYVPETDTQRRLYEPYRL